MISMNTISKAFSTSLLLLVFTGANAMLPTPAEAQPIASANNTNNNSGITSQINTYIVSKDNTGAEQITPVSANTQIKRGDVIEYRMQITNPHSEEVSSMKVTIEVPPQVKLLDKFDPILDEASVDGTNFYPTPIRGRMNGQIQNVPVEYYKALRWNVTDLGVNESANLVYRAVIR